MQSLPIPRARAGGLALVLACVIIGAVAPRGDAIVPPSDCGTLTVKSKRYNVKADQLRCGTARTYAKRYLAVHRKPTGYRCRDFGAETKLKFRCSRGIQVFFAIRR
ncbi:MAG TPA: hypothetical protein VMY78_15655 [Solirubrobacteraceae bacterium]|nr:hypothetical protein [Solirubrobacteraceae bacterium]